MNHLKTGNAFFGAGSYKAYKFLGQELQETGFYDMNARFYMADLGRFGTHDPLSSSTFDPYGYAYNNPMLFADPSGLEGEPVNGGPGGPSVTPASFGSTPGGYDGDPMLIAGAGINDVAAEQGIQGVVLNSKGKSSNSAAAMPTNCIACSVGSGVTSGIELSKPQPTPLPLNWDCGHCNDHGVVMMDSMWDVVGIAIANNVKPENKYAAMGVTLLAALITRSPSVAKAEVGIAKAEASIAKAEAKTEIYSVAYEMKLAEGSYPGVYRGGHFREANEALEAAMKSDAKFATSIEKLGITLPRSPAGSILGKSPKNWVWHHHVDEGIMQLVPKTQHTVGSSFWSTMHPGNKGGFSIWGK